MKFIAAALCLLIGCDGDGGGREATEGEIGQACGEIAERMCCGLTGDDADICFFHAKSDACFLGNVGGELYQQSSVDFAACNAALDEAPADLCSPSCVYLGAVHADRRCFDVPPSCITANCEENPDACVVDSVPST